MKIYTDILVPEHIKHQLDHHQCDFCRQRIVGDGLYDAYECYLSAKTGNSYPDGGSGEEITFDACQKCMTEKIVPMLQDLALNKVKWEAWDW